MNLQNLSASSAHDTTFEFQLRTEGVDISNGKVCFIVKGEQFNYEFPCVHVIDSNYKVVIPKSLKLSTTQYFIRVFAEGFVFEPASGALEFVNPEQVTASKVKSDIPQPPESQNEEVKPASKKEKTRGKSVISVTAEDAPPVPLVNIDVDQIIQSVVKQSELDDVFEQRTDREQNLNADEAIRSFLQQEKERKQREEQERRDAQRKQLEERQLEAQRQRDAATQREQAIRRIAQEYTQ